MPAPDVHGPVDFVVIEFPEDASGTETAAALFELVEQGTVRVFDLLVVRKGADGTAEEVDLSAAGGPLGSLKVLAGARSGLLGAGDVDDAASVLEPGTVAVVLLYENAWATPFVAAARGEGGQLVASARLSAQDIMDALDAAESAD
jgi:uncharacterized membrane protein